jgi:hypothetical protein
MRTILKIIGAGILVLLIFCVWYWFAADYSYGAVSGTYAFQSNEESSVLMLRKDKVFLQERTSHGRTERAQGTWRRVGEGGIVLSAEFLPVGQINARPDGSVDGEVQKSFLELIPSIVLWSDNYNGPRFHRMLFHSKDLDTQ